MKKLLFIFGTRPEAVKLAPLILALQKSTELDLRICNTGQHREMAEKTLSFFSLRSDYNLNVMQQNQTLIALQARIMEKLSALLERECFDGIIVQGDTMSTYCGALTGYYCKIPVFHVEAGLRSASIDEPFPEEGLRQMITRIAALHFTPDHNAAKNLLKENIPQEKIVVTGNTVIDALCSLTPEHYSHAEKELLEYGVQPERKTVLATVHRRENHGERLEHILAALQHIAERFPEHQIVIPVHPNPAVKERVTEKLSPYKNILLLPPLDYPLLCFLMKHSALILTDSGGIQEEAPTFGTPILVMREKTERNEGVFRGCAILVGTETEKIFTTAEDFLLHPEKRYYGENPYGDGNASERILETIINFYNVEQK